MSEHLVTCAPDTTSANIESLMAAARIRRLPVVDRDGKLIGLVTLSDIARYSVSSPLHFPTVPAVAKTLAAISEPRDDKSGAAA